VVFSGRIVDWLQQGWPECGVCLTRADVRVVLHLQAQRFVSVLCIFLLSFAVYYCNGLKITWAFRWLDS
jgi:hypothetical protein